MDRDRELCTKATVGCFWPIFFFADHNEAWHTLAGVCIPSLNASLALPV